MDVLCWTFRVLVYIAEEHERSFPLSTDGPLLEEYSDFGLKLGLNTGFRKRIRIYFLSLEES